jgi:hypothetical protein
MDFIRRSGLSTPQGGTMLGLLWFLSAGLICLLANEAVKG